MLKKIVLSLLLVFCGSAIADCEVLNKDPKHSIEICHNSQVLGKITPNETMKVADKNCSDLNARFFDTEQVIMKPTRINGIAANGQIVFPDSFLSSPNFCTCHIGSRGGILARMPDGRIFCNTAIHC